MNRLLFTSIISWRTRNWRRSLKAERWCKDYGLVEMQKNLFIGKLYPSEHIALIQKMSGLFEGKNDHLCSFVVCASCSPNIVANPAIKNPPWLDSAYEIIRD